MNIKNNIKRKKVNPAPPAYPLRSSENHSVHFDVNPIDARDFYVFFWSDRVCIGDKLGTRRRLVLL